MFVKNVKVFVWIQASVERCCSMSREKILVLKTYVGRFFDGPTALSSSLSSQRLFLHNAIVHGFRYSGGL